jgi:hypothetical protein
MVYIQRRCEPVADDCKPRINLVTLSIAKEVQGNVEELSNLPQRLTQVHRLRKHGADHLEFARKALQNMPYRIALSVSRLGGRLQLGHIFIDCSPSV